MFGERLREIGKFIQDFRLLPYGYRGDAELKKLYFELRQPAKVDDPIVYNEPDTITKQSIAYLNGETDLDPSSS